MFLIINILITEWPLTIKYIHNKAKRDYGCNKSYQAIQKSINGLIEEGVIKKNVYEYQLSIEWLRRLNSFSRNVIKNYVIKNNYCFGEGIAKVEKDYNVTRLTFNSLLDLDKFWIAIKREYYQKIKQKNQVTVWEGNHCWWLLIYPEAEYDTIKIAKSKLIKSYKISHCNNLLDQWSKKFYGESGTKFKI